MDPAQTRRVILLIDLHPLFAVQDPSHYVAAVLASARRLLSFPPLSGSLFAFKPYFSSLSPLRSSSLIQRLFGKSAIFLSFDRPSQIIKLLSASLHPSNYDGDIIGRLDRPRASLVRDSLFQLAYDCMWEPPGESSVDKSGISSVRSNMIVNFSPIPRSENCLSQFLDLSTSDEIKSEMNEIRNKFVQIFGPLNELFISKDVHFSWIHVDRDSQLSVNLLYKEFIDIGWSTCSAHAIAFGAVFIPFGLIYSYIGHQLPSYSVDVQGQCRVDLNLEISDARGESLECKCCDLDVHFLKNQRETTGILDFFSRDAQGLPRMVVKDVLHLSNLSKIKSRRVATLLLRGVCDIEERVDDKTGVFSPTKILELFREDGVSPAAGKPIWQLVLSFLRRRSFCALVSVDRGNGQSLCGYVLPFTVHSAVMYVVDDLILDNCGPHCSEPAKDKHRRRKKNRIQRLVHELNYHDFYKHVFNENSETNLEVDLEDLYFAKGCNISKKLRFFQCWMKQFRNHSHSCTDVSGHGISSGCKEVKGERPVGSELDTSRPASPISCSDDIIQFVEKNEECPSQILRQSMESFSETVSLKNKRILSSKESDLSLFAERIVKLAANYFSAKLGSGEKKDDLNAVVAAEVLKALLERPKDILAKYKSPCVLDEVIKVREHELQILIRMEILQSAIGASIEERGKLKIVSDVCSLLENIEFDLQGSMFTGESLIEFATRTIKARYLRSLESVVQKIFERMEFISFDRAEEDSATLPYSNSSEQQRDEKDDVTPARRENSDGCENAMMKALEKREKARRYSHFASARQNLQRVWAPRQAHKNKSTGESSSFGGSSSKKTKRPLSSKGGVCETPMVRDRHHSAGSGARVSKALFGVQD